MYNIEVEHINGSSYGYYSVNFVPRIGEQVSITGVPQIVVNVINILSSQRTVIIIQDL